MKDPNCKAELESNEKIADKYSSAICWFGFWLFMAFAIFSGRCSITGQDGTVYKMGPR